MRPKRAPNWGEQQRNPPLRVVGEPTGDLDALLTEWANWQEAGNLSRRTIKERAGTIRNLVTSSGCGPLELEPRHIIAFVTREGLANSSKASYHATIRAYCQWLQRTGKRLDDPTLSTPVPKRSKGVPRPISEEQLQMILARVNRRRSRAMILLAAYQGLRVHEIAKVRGEDVDLDRRNLYVVGKGNKPAVLPLHPLVAAVASQFPRRGFWFPSYGEDGPVGSHAVMQAITRTMERCGVDATSHQLRHYFGTTLCARDVPLRVVQTLMRHESPATTALYTLVTDEQARAGIDAL
ncbi:MAG: tyrosine-type recombinase/integrase [Paenarthrobacter ureafaciens]|uniref:tyrosine-type recombinase/integrase n=1 Tax=Paenarthrobacter ureafaciens TaxID=37931 RepID=UPI001AD2F162|nr:tyrosine-type recombinase/integrase [Paenarthrobacter ureafaciens]MBN9128493.1 tyrosine-type recombinase/integrase [Paenarthrobacter ureafaciens]